MGKMKEPLTDHVQCRVTKPSGDLFGTADFLLVIFRPDRVYIRHMHSGEAGTFPLSTFEAEVCPWEELGSKDNVAELVSDFYSRHF